jgi:subtilisin family serine protease
MQKLRARWLIGRIPLAFSLMLGMASGGTYEVRKVSEVKKAPAFSPMKKAALLNFPELPREIQDKIRGNRVRPALPATKVDTALSQEWGLVNIGFFEVFTPLIQPIRTNVEPCSSAVTVAVVDTGIDYTHPDLKENIWINAGESGAWEPPKGTSVQVSCRDKSCNGIDDDNNGFVDDVVGWDFVNDVPLPYDVHGHGTHIAGIIASEPANGVGVVGVCPKVKIMSLKYYDNSGIGYNNLQNTVRAIHYAVRNGAQIINYSGGGADPASSERAAIEEAQRKGILFVAAAGNDGKNNDQIPYYPASYPLDNIISVASLTKENQLLPSSNFGARSVQVAAPGLQILSDLPTGKFGTMSGTSQATAFVTGAAALLASQFKDRSQFDYHKIKSWIAEGAKPLPGNDGHRLVASGMLSVSKSIQIQKEDMLNKKGTPALRTDIALRPERASKAQ